MKPCLVVDENLPRRLATELRGRGLEASSLNEMGLAGSPDDAVLEALGAMDQPAVLLTFDNKLPLDYPEQIRTSNVAVAVIASTRIPDELELIEYLKDVVHRHAPRARGYQPATVAMDKGYDNNRVMDETRERRGIPIVCLRKGRPVPMLPIPFHSYEWKRLYRGRSAVEREFGRLKHDYGFAPLRVRGIERVRLHADLTMLARLALALNRAQAMPLATVTLTLPG